ncbi:MAG: bifunctional riboflavin kinase/FAD synthetase [Candidatus Margulisbacteria bacterium]|nr:bifunctional riboflavin kinase/FAD synthetase [Candidatus Margulisiibacteriota bacterium]MBU1021370.1 bifunctional riboflavin kinase/FAD synthetase [Candidatus Margulisiibacteriota bacterium]MBU1729141.1 bifunctional riboflavin kinase/FAD synthetase [Candidatus Margulisiibacteriota bacterium]MBU1954814.1 bifunctional riboflavin kinase/FAD synthetase [Candidatus Margulisiibacteriota bacterium]
MRIIRHPKKSASAELPMGSKKLKGCVVALGTFDGVHRGHQKVLKGAVAYAKRSGTASLAITFDPHPQQLIVPERGLRLLTTLQERENLFCEYGIDGVVVIVFNRRVQKLSNAGFVKKYLVGKLGVKHVFVGFDYAFGRGRSGDVAHLKKLGKKYGFEVTVVPPVAANHHAIKSRMIREMISRGDFAKAIMLLGHPYHLSGKVVNGSGRGRTLGFPTANLALDPQKLIPAYGVYVGHVYVGKNKHKCCVNIGARPTFGAGKAIVEVHIIKFKGNLRGKNLRVVLSRRLRDEIHFSDVEKLKAQIRRDISMACR